MPELRLSARTHRWTRLLSSTVLCLLAVAVSASAANQGQTLGKEKIEPVLRQFVFQRSPWKPENVEIRIIAFPPVTLPLGESSVRIVKPTQRLTPGLQSFLIVADVAGKEEARLWIKAEIKVFENVVVSSVPLAHHEVPSEKDVRIERRDISSLTGRPFTKIKDIIGQQAARAIEVNEILTQKLLERPNLVKRGSAITLLYETGNLSIETPGTAEEAGKAGDTIQVKNASSGKMLRGIVLDGRAVRVN